MTAPHARLWDCAVVGAGPAGAAAALVLAREGRSVWLVDRGVRGPARPGESLPGAARPLLRDLGALGAVERGPHLRCCGNVSAWGSAEAVPTDFIADPHGAGWHLDRPRFDADLRDAARRAGAALQAGTVTSVRREAGVWHLDFGGTVPGGAVPGGAGPGGTGPGGTGPGGTGPDGTGAGGAGPGGTGPGGTDAGGTGLEAAWLIDATGRTALAALRGLARRSRDDALVALYAWARLPGAVGDGGGDGFGDRDGDRDEGGDGTRRDAGARSGGPASDEADPPQGAPAWRDSRTWIESAPDGWWYGARLPDGRAAVAFHTDADAATAILRTPGAWEQRLARAVHVGGALRGAVFPEAPRGTEACGARLDRFAGPGWLAVGDAALSFDPLSAQGIFAALYTGLRGGQAVAAALSGAAGAVAAYATRLESVRAAYLRQQAHFYGRERRWPEHPFWRRRHAAAAAHGGGRAGRLAAPGPAGGPGQRADGREV